MNWGLRITILTLGFVCFMSFLVIGAMMQSFDLVTEDYYGKELQFQKQIEKQINQKALVGNIKLIDSEDNLIIQFPAEFISKSISGKVTFFRPSDARRDIVKEINAESGQYILNKDLLIKGLYRVQIDYGVDGVEYYYEDSIMI